MAKRIVISPNKCIGCSSCVLTCAITYGDAFDLKKAHIQIYKDDFTGIFQISFRSTCYSCCRCALACPSQCLTVVEAAEGEKEAGK